MNPWLASPVVFLAGFLLLYVNSRFAWIAGLSLIGSALVLAAAPGDTDNWYLAVALVAIGMIAFFVRRPRWLTTHPSGRWQFGLSGLLVATTALGICLAFNLWTWRHADEQLKIARAVDSILTKYTSTVGWRDGNVIWLSVNDIPPYETLGGISESYQIDCSHWFRSGVDGTQKPFGDGDLVQIARQHSNLRCLDLRESDVTENGLQHLQLLHSLEQLWLDSAQCTSVGLTHLHQLAGLKRLTIEPFELTEPDLAALKAALPGCEIGP